MAGKSEGPTSMPWMPGEALLIRLWESVERFAIGVASPTQIKREAKARAQARRFEALLDAQTKRDVEALVAGSAVQPSLLPGPHPDPLGLPVPQQQMRREPTLILTPQTAADVEQLAQLRSRVDSIEKLLNLRAIHRIAEEAIEEDFAGRDIPEERPGRDWLNAWRNGAEIVSEEEVQMLWARLLCEEVSAPGSFSKRTIETLKTLGSSEAKTLSKIAPFVIENCILKLKEDQVKPFAPERYIENVNFTELLELQAAGLLVDVGGTLSVQMVTLKRDDGKNSFLLKTPSNWFIDVTYEDPHKINVPAIPVSPVGSQLLRLGRFSVDEKQPFLFVESIKGQTKADPVEISLVRLQDMKNGHVRAAEKKILTAK